MMKFVLFCLLFFGITVLSAQTAISGHFSENENELPKEIHLSKIALEDLPNYAKAKRIATAGIDKNGFFKFKKNLISEKQAIYRLHVKRFKKVLQDTIQVDKLFLLSSRDSIHFKKSKTPFTNYTNSNMADSEWQKLRSYEKRLRPFDFKKEDSLSEAYITSLKSYTKDSVEILMVKLIGIKQLDNKDLLEKDIAKNPEYYVALLSELKASEIARSEYLFLENKLAFITTETAEKKYATSKTINIILGLSITGLILVIIRFLNRRNIPALPDLSKQEKNIQALILEGKTNKEIANELFISLSTVKTHITNIYGKLQVSGRKELVRKVQNS